MSPAAPGAAGSAASAPAIAVNSSAASVTVRVIGPAVSCETEIGMMPRRLTRPTVGFKPTSPFTADGQMMLPSVSVPTPKAARLDATAAPVPELEPHGLRSRAYGFLVCPPRELHPDEDRVERKFAHPLRLVLPRITAPAARSRVTRNASCLGRWSASAMEPAELTRPATSTLSLMRMGR